MLRIIALLTVFALPAYAQCMGQNLIDTMSPQMEAEVDAAVAEHPFPEGNRWRATRDGQEVTLIGTYHLYDARLNVEMLAAQPLLDAAPTLLVEAGPEEEAAMLRHMATNPQLTMIAEGPTLPEMLEPAEWDALTAAAQARGIPAFMAAKFQPWYLLMVLAMAPCHMAQAEAPGLDKMLIAAAQAQGKPVAALEPWNTALDLFSSMTPEEQLDAIRMTLEMEPKATDYASTLADAYFAGDARRMWEFMRVAAHDLPGYSPEQADAEFAEMEQIMMIDRNRAWIPVIEEAAEHGPVLVAFGALHLAGHDGVLALLEREGFTLTPLP